MDSSNVKGSASLDESDDDSDVNSGYNETKMPDNSGEDSGEDETEENRALVDRSQSEDVDDDRTFSDRIVSSIIMNSVYSSKSISLSSCRGSSCSVDDPLDLNINKSPLPTDVVSPYVIRNKQPFGQFSRYVQPKRGNFKKDSKKLKGQKLIAHSSENVKIINSEFFKKPYSHSKFPDVNPVFNRGRKKGKSKAIDKKDSYFGRPQLPERSRTDHDRKVSRYMDIKNERTGVVTTVKIFKNESSVQKPKSRKNPACKPEKPPILAVSRVDNFLVPSNLAPKKPDSGPNVKVVYNNYSDDSIPYNYDGSNHDDSEYISISSDLVIAHQETVVTSAEDSEVCTKEDELPCTSGHVIVHNENCTASPCFLPETTSAVDSTTEPVNDNMIKSSVKLNHQDTTSLETSASCSVADEPFPVRHVQLPTESCPVDVSSLVQGNISSCAVSEGAISLGVQDAPMGYVDSQTNETPVTSCEDVILLVENSISPNKVDLLHERELVASETLPTDIVINSEKVLETSDISWPCDD